MLHILKVTGMGLGLWFAISLLNACKGNNGGQETSSGEPDTLRIMVSVPPLADLVQKVGGNELHVDILVDKGQDPHTFSPSPAQMKTLGMANILLTVGMPFEEALIEKITDTNAGITVVDAAAGIEKLELEHHHHEEDEEETEDGHDHHDHDSDPHVWLAPYSIQVQLDNIEKALAAAIPAKAGKFAENLKKARSELNRAHEQITGKLKPFAGRKFFVFHPAFGYFANEYGLEQIAIEIGGNSPTPSELIGFLAVARAAEIQVIFIQPQFDPRSAEVIAKELGAKVAILDPLAPDVIANLHAITDAIVEGFSGLKGGL